MAASVAAQVRLGRRRGQSGSPTAGLGARIHEEAVSNFSTVFVGVRLRMARGFPEGPEPRREGEPSRRDGPFPEFSHEVPPHPESFLLDLHQRLGLALEAELNWLLSILGTAPVSVPGSG